MFNVIMTLMFGSLMEVVIWKAGWKFALTGSGALCVMTSGVTKMQVLCAGSWDMQHGVSAAPLRNQLLRLCYVMTSIMESA